MQKRDAKGKKKEILSSVLCELSQRHCRFKKDQAFYFGDML